MSFIPISTFTKYKDIKQYLLLEWNKDVITVVTPQYPIEIQHGYSMKTLPRRIYDLVFVKNKKFICQRECLPSHDKTRIMKVSAWEKTFFLRKPLSFAMSFAYSVG